MLPASKELQCAYSSTRDHQSPRRSSQEMDSRLWELGPGSWSPTFPRVLKKISQVPVGEGGGISEASLGMAAQEIKTWNLAELSFPRLPGVE